MIWKLLGLQEKLDALFDEGWVTLGLFRQCNAQVVQSPLHAKE